MVISSSVSSLQLQVVTGDLTKTHSLLERTEHQFELKARQHDNQTMKTPCNQLMEKFRKHVSS